MFKELFTEDRGVSPVIGVILMVAITVILAAVIGAFVLGLGDQVSNNAPQASFEFDFDANKTMNITHGGGEDLETSNIDVSVAGDTILQGGDDNTGSISAFDSISGTWVTEDTISTGDALDVTVNSTADPRGDTVRIVWNNPSGGSSNTIGERDWPN